MPILPPPPYAELCCLTNFTFLTGSSHPEEFVDRARSLGYHALAVTDECSVAGIVRAWDAWRRNPSNTLRLIVGSLIRLEDGPAVVLLATDRAAYGRLAALITRGRRAAVKGRYRLTRADLEDGLPGCLALLLPPDGPLDPPALANDAHWLATRFPGELWLAAPLLLGADDAARRDTLAAVAAAAGIPVVATATPLMHAPERRRLADVLTALRHRRPLDDAGYRLAANGERHLQPREVLALRHPPAWLAETLAVAARCTFALDSLRYEYPEEIVPPGLTPTSHLRRLVNAGLARRYPPPGTIPAVVRTQVNAELALIAELGYEAFFLTVEDIVRFARSQGILCQGRGSAANSVVCYALGITEVDPAQATLLFERFISRERNEPPDIDVDFEHDRREEVIQYLYAKYGRDRAALAAAVIRYRPRSALRDVGRALGFDTGQLDQITRRLAWWDGRRVAPERLAEAGLDPASPQVHQLLDLADQLIGFPRHLSQHVGGFVIARGPLAELVPVENAAMAGRTVIQWDKDDLEALGLLKVDVLALGMLSAIRRSLDLIAAWQGRPFGLPDIPREDPQVYAMLRAADAIGVFQVESRAQLSMLPRLQPRCFYDLVVEVAIVRPGPIQGGMVHPYLQARERLARGESLYYPRPEIRPVLERTHGVPIFQEQVMQLAMVAAGFSAGEADQLRRAMGAWGRKGQLHLYQARLAQGMAERGYPPEFAAALCRQIEGFGSYGFPESHAASFALLVYVSAWIKRFHPAAFLCALLNSQPMGFYSPSQLIQDARRQGVAVLPADVCTSDGDSTLEAPPGAPQPAVRLGLERIKGIGRDAARRIATARRQAPFASVDELTRRARLDPADLRALAAGGALSQLAGHRRQALWAATGSQPAPGLLRDAAIPDLPPPLPAPSEAQNLVADYAHLGFTLGRHPLSLLRSHLRAERFLPAREIADCPDRKLARAAGLVTCRQRPGTAKGILFVTLEDETGLINVIVRPELVEAERRILLGATLLGVYGQITRQGPVVHLHAKRVVDRSWMLGDLVTRSRDFH
ncbi:MAG TPA: error-prone DNA polymerase [Zoogloea sp.]|uniref:error-prone DNA polymerase n=1 Tax=Zoogloea sp. TaxID=49181 RepID=UPI002C0FF6EC|nr:error-prone DNA polymerase [Zoogloea sp.]HNI46711.1 error-prone DNA polymerase [Zoogloea sp.]